MSTPKYLVLSEAYFRAEAHGFPHQDFVEGGPDPVALGTPRHFVVLRGQLGVGV